MSLPNIAVVVPTIRPEQFDLFLEAWTPLFLNHEVTLIAVHDGDNPSLRAFSYSNGIVPEKWALEDGDTPDTVAAVSYLPEEIMGQDLDLIYFKNDGCRNLGFAFVGLRLPHVDVVITLDDDVRPVGDTIQDHIDALSRKYPTTWMNSSMTTYMRGFPYWVREEAECVVSHGVWEGVADFDASTQLVLGNHPQEFYRGAVPAGIFMPMCIMNVAFKREWLPYMYQAPMYGDINRFADIWGGYYALSEAHQQGKAIVTGFATILHERASDPLVNLVKEARGVGMHERFSSSDVHLGHPDFGYWDRYHSLRNRWATLLQHEILR